MSTGEGRPEPRFDWFIPIDGDGNRAGTRSAQRPPDFDYLRQVVETAEECGFYSLLIPTRFANGLFAEDAPLAETWTTATALAAVTQRIRFLVAVRPGFISLGLFAHMAAAFHQEVLARDEIGGIREEEHNRPDQVFGYLAARDGPARDLLRLFRVHELAPPGGQDAVAPR